MDLFLHCFLRTELKLVLFVYNIRTVVTWWTGKFYYAGVRFYPLPRLICSPGCGVLVLYFALRTGLELVPFQYIIRTFVTW